MEVEKQHPPNLVTKIDLVVRRLVRALGIYIAELREMRLI